MQPNIAVFGRSNADHTSNGHSINLTEKHSKEKSWLPGAFTSGPEYFIMIRNMPPKEQGDRTPGESSKLSVTTTRVPKQELLRHGFIGTKTFSAETSREKPKLTGSSTEEPSKPLFSKSKSLGEVPESQAGVLYQPRVTQPAVSHAQALNSFPSDEEYTSSPELTELRQRLRNRRLSLSPDEFMADLAEASPGNPFVQQLIAGRRTS